MTQNAEQVRAAIIELQTLPRADLVACFRRLYRAEPPQQISRDLLLRAISWRLQQKVCGKQDRALQRRLQKLATELRRTGSIQVTRASMAPTSLKPGTRLVREWQGRLHEVSVAEDGFVYLDQRYRSLSEIARTITGTRWSGPAFFGLNGTRAGKGARAESGPGPEAGTGDAGPTRGGPKRRAGARYTSARDAGARDNHDRGSGPPDL